MVSKEWYFEDFTIGDRFVTRKRVVTETEADLFPLLTGAINPMFLSDEYARRAGHGRERRTIPNLVPLAISIGLAYQTGIFDQTRFLHGFDKVRYFTHIYPGEIFTAEFEIIKKDDLDKDAGIVTYKDTVLKETGEKLLEGEIILTVLKRGAKADPP